MMAAAGRNLLMCKRHNRCSCGRAAVELNVKAAGRQVCDLCRRSNGRKLRKQRRMRQRWKKKSGEGGYETVQYFTGIVKAGLAGTSVKQKCQSALLRERGFIHFYRHLSSEESGTLSQVVPPEHSSRAKCFLWSHFLIAL